MASSTNGARKRHYDLRVWGHSNILYWWVIWAYGYVCAAVTYFYGTTIKLSEASRPFQIYEGSWLGWSFLVLLLMTIMFSAIRIKGYLAVIGILGLLFAIEILDRTGNLIMIVANVPDLVVYMNLGFYFMFSNILLIVWLIALFIFDPLTYWQFQEGQLLEVHTLDDEDDKVYPTIMMSISRRPMDFLRKALGLFQTGDMRLSPQREGQYSIIIPNVWKVEQKIKRALEVIRQQ
ncbi:MULTISPECIES: hypothetical protein [Rhodomicrobium]|uniref:hypothetical protein n=1 Tax=Rhodomicrobium TaxID=1068 RepID=UPI000F73DC32|nr:MULTISPECIES: hypothetical protein [Rhodomicrobium]